VGGDPERGAAVHFDSGHAAHDVRRDAHVDRTGSGAPDAQQLRGRLVTQHGLATAGKQRRDPRPVPAELRTADRVHPAVYEVQPAGGESVANRVGAEAEGHELVAREHAALLLDESPDLAAARLKDRGGHRPFNASAGRDSPPAGRQR